MSIFNEILPKLFEISDLCAKNINRDLKDALESLDKFEEEFQSQNGRRKTREKALKDKTAILALQSIDEVEVTDEPRKQSDQATDSVASKTQSDSQNNDDKPRRPKKRSKSEVDDASPEQDRRVKRNASVKAQSIISKQVNVNLTQKLRREKSTDKPDSARQSSRRKQKDEEKENCAPNELPIVQIKQEKISMLPEQESMETESMSLPSDIEIKQEKLKDDIAMPPPAAPVPKPRRAARERAAAPPVEETRRSRRAAKDVPPPEPMPVESRPKRTRGRKKLSDASKADSGHASLSAGSVPASPDKPRPKRTRRGQKANSEIEKPVEQEEPTVSPKEERPSQEQVSSPILTKQKNKKTVDLKNKYNKTNSTEELSNTQNVDKDITDGKIVDKISINSKNSDKKSTNSKSSDKNSTDSDNNEKNSTNIKNIDNEIKSKNVKNLPDAKKLDKHLTNTKMTEDSKKTVAQCDDKDLAQAKVNGVVETEDIRVAGTEAGLDETRVITKTVEMDQTMVLPNGVYNHAPVTPKAIRLDETVVLEKTLLLDKRAALDATVVLDRGPVQANLTDDDSLLTDDSDAARTPPAAGAPPPQPLSAVKEKVQQFEEMATRVTRTKTRAMAKKEEENDPETQTPPDKVSRAVLSTDTLSKMNSLIFNGKAPQTCVSASKPRAPVRAPASASKSRASDDPRHKKEALLEAKRDLQRRKREEKMAAAAAARSAAERERRALQDAAARERREKLLQAELERGERLREAERKKQEQARKIAETEERRRAEEAARLLRLADEQRKAATLQQRKHEEQEAMRREEANMKEMEKKKKEYMEKQKKQKLDRMTPLKGLGSPKLRAPLPPAHMEDGFQYLHSDEDAEPVDRPVPAWSTSKARRARLALQARVRRAVVDAWFRVGACSPDLADIFPAIERARLKRTSSAVWRTPPRAT